MLGFIGYTMAMVQAEWLPKTLGLGFDQPYVDHRPPGRPGPWERSSARSRASSSPTSACRRSSSRSAACWSGAASSAGTRRARRSPPLDQTFQLLGGGARARSARGSAGSSGSSPAWAIVVRSGNSRRRRRRYGFPVRPTLGRGAPRRRRLRRRARRGRHRQRLPPGPCPRQGMRGGATGSRPEGGLIIPSGFPSRS